MSKNTTVCYIRDGDKYLMMHRIKKENDPNRGKWIGIGGLYYRGEELISEKTKYRSIS